MAFHSSVLLFVVEHLHEGNMVMSHYQRQGARSGLRRGEAPRCKDNSLLRYIITNKDTFYLINAYNIYLMKCYTVWL